MGQRWQAATYDTNMVFVSGYGESLLEWLDAQPGERIIDWGCGTGDLAVQIAARGATVIGVDASKEMLNQAANKSDHIEWVHADAQRYVLAPAVDKIFSNAALHWMTDAEQTAKSIASSLISGGRFVAEFGGAGNIAGIISALQIAFTTRGIEEQLQLPWYFPTIGSYTSLLESVGFRVEMATNYARPTVLTEGEAGLAQWLEVFASGILAPLDEIMRAAIIADVVSAARPQLWDETEGVWIADYRRIRIVAIRE